MAVNKVIFDGETLIDLTEDTVTADKLLSGTTAHDASGNAITGNIATKYGGLSATVEPLGPADLGGNRVIRLIGEVDSPCYISPSTGGLFTVDAPISSFGDATADDVVAGKTFTSTAGLKVTGTIPNAEDYTF